VRRKVDGIELRAAGAVESLAHVDQVFFIRRFFARFFVLSFSCFACGFVLTFHEVRPLVFVAPCDAVRD
jgi:hypothetical protein